MDRSKQELINVLLAMLDVPRIADTSEWLTARARAAIKEAWPDEMFGEYAHDRDDEERAEQVVAAKAKHAAEGERIKARIAKRAAQDDDSDCYCRTFSGFAGIQKAREVLLGRFDEMFLSGRLHEEIKRFRLNDGDSRFFEEYCATSKLLYRIFELEEELLGRGWT